MSIADSPRGKSYIWVTWLTGLLAGTDKCEWKPWYKAHFKYAKRQDEGPGFDLAAWTVQHDSMTDARVKQLKEEGWPVVQVEEQNAFKLVGQSAILSGKPDIVAINVPEGRALVVDEKSGRERESDVWQVLTYMFSLPLTWLKIPQLDGEIEYRGSSRAVPGDLFTSEAKQSIVSVLRMAGSDVEPSRTPSAGECRFCDILACPERFKETKNATADASRFF